MVLWYKESMIWRDKFQVIKVKMLLHKGFTIILTYDTSQSRFGFEFSDKHLLLDFQ